MSYVKNGYLEQDAKKFPYPREVNGGSYGTEDERNCYTWSFPYPLEETGVSYGLDKQMELCKVEMFPYPPEVTGVSYLRKLP